MPEDADPILQRVLEEVEREVSRSLDEPGEKADQSPSSEAMNSRLDDNSDASLSGGEEMRGLSFPSTELRDRVTIMLLFVQAVEARHVNRAWKRRQQMSEDDQPALWRLLAEDPDLDTETIYREAARLYSFEEAQIEKLHALSVMREIASTLDEEMWERMKTLHVIPVDVQNVKEVQAPRLVFATHDPMRPSVHRLIEQLNLDHFGLEYAPKQLIEALLAGMEQSGPTSLLSPEEMGLKPESEDQEETATREEDKQEGEVARSTLVDLFETALVESVRRGAIAVHLYPNAKRQVEILLQMDDHINRWHVEERVPPEVFLTVVKEKMHKRKKFAKKNFEEQTFQRWIDRKRVRFHVSVRSITNAKRQNLLDQIEIQRLIGE